jgi:hypothetical protein
MTTPPLGAAPMPPHEVACVELDARLELSSHRHVTFVQTRDPDGGLTRWSRMQVIAAIRNGERFAVAGESHGHLALLEPGLCPSCPFFTLRVNRPDAMPAQCG